MQETREGIAINLIDFCDGGEREKQLQLNCLKIAARLEADQKELTAMFDLGFFSCMNIVNMAVGEGIVTLNREDSEGRTWNYNFTKRGETQR